MGYNFWMVKIAQILFLWIGTAALTWGFYRADEMGFDEIILAAAALWTLGVIQRWKRAPGFGAFSFALFAAIGIYREIPLGWMFAGALYAYLAYDLHQFYLRLRLLVIQSGTREMTRVHFVRLALVVFFGMLISSLAMLFQDALDLSWMIFLGASVLLGAVIFALWQRENVW